MPVISYTDLVKKRSQIQNDIDTKKLNVDACFFGKSDLKFTKALSQADKSSSSDTIIAFGELKSIPVAIKISFLSLDPEHNASEVEAKIYNDLMPEMLEFSPHLLDIDYVIQCNDMFNYSKPGYTTYILSRTPEEYKAIQTIYDESNRIRQLSYDTKKATFIITEKTNGKSLGDWLNSGQNYDPDTVWLPIYFQIAYTLMIFEKFGLMHYDLHTNNVFVDVLDTPQTFSYKIGNDYYNITTSMFIRIYDFDHGYKASTALSRETIDNKTLENYFCKSLGECNKFQPKWDWFTLLAYSFLANNQYVNDHIIGKCIPLDVRTQIRLVARALKGIDKTGLHSWIGKPCICNDKTCSTCTVSTKILDELTSPADFIKKYMKKYKSNKPPSPPRPASAMLDFDLDQILI